MKATKGKSIVVYLLLGLLVLSLGGFGIANFGGTVQSLGKVGDTDIPITGYVNTLNAERRALSDQVGREVSMAEARQFGLDRAALQKVIAATALDNEAARIELSIGDEQVLEQIVSFSAFQGPAGFDRDTYEFVLEQNGLTPSEFEDSLRVETARTLLQSAVLGGVAMPDSYGASLYAYIGETRSFVWAKLDESDLDTPIAAPTDAVLSDFLTANASAFTTPETRAITYVLLAPDMLEGQITLTEDELRAAYDARIDDFVQPESRLVARLVFADADQAAAARARLDAGEISFADLVEERGLTPADVDLGQVLVQDLSDTAAAAVFAAEGAGIVGPVDSDFGPALFQINGILAAQEISFDDAKAQIEPDLRAAIAADMVADEAELIDDLLAGGATLEEIAAETRMAVGTVTVSAADQTGLMADPVFAEAALALADGDFPELLTLADDRLAAMRLDAVTPPVLPALADIRDDVAAAWRAAELQTRLMARAEDLARRANDDGLAFAALGLRPATTSLHLTRDMVPDTADTALPAAAFALEDGAFGAAAGGRDVYVVQLLSITGPDTDDAEGAFLRSILTQQANQGLAADVMDAFTVTLQSQAGLTLDQAALNAVNAQLQ